MLHGRRRQAVGLAKPAILGLLAATGELIPQLAMLLNARPLIHVVQVELLQAVARRMVSLQELLQLLHCLVVLLAARLLTRLILFHFGGHLVI